MASKLSCEPHELVQLVCAQKVMIVLTRFLLIVKIIKYVYKVNIVKIIFIHLFTLYTYLYGCTFIFV